MSVHHKTQWPAIEVWVDAPCRVENRNGGYSVYGAGLLGYDDPVALVHVVSASCGGEVHGYVLHDGRLFVRTPANHGPWPEMDAEVSRVLGVPVVPMPCDTPEPATPRQADLFLDEVAP